ncbi:glycosyltransferase [Clostridium beijerinckii]|nr:glycosyltransferase [Clostridium beijerinckii]NOW03894.1 glycosyltransferase involved in cell wall biosynthesis [Clostridium beijerinckii]NYC02965.1 glycosyltransferase involved in cell wall biosynthesis [Clostridium beijerinckii]
MKKLLFITWNITSGYGTEKSLADVLNLLDKYKYDISILPLFKTSNVHVYNSNIKILDALIDSTKEGYNEKDSLDYYYKLLVSPLLFNKLINEKYDCVIACNHSAPSYFASYLNCATKIIWIRGDMRELDYNWLDKNSNEYRQIKQEHEMQASVLKQFDSIVVISDVVEKSLSELFGITENVVKISNSVNREKIHILSNEKISIPDKMLFTSVGRLDFNKNQILLLKAAKELKLYRDDFMIYLLGDGDYKLILQKYIEDNELTENVKLIGYVENPYPYIKNSTATILTSLSEGFSLALVESVILNTPIISTDVGVARELVEKYKCGNIIHFDEKELFGILLWYLNNPYRYNRVFDINNDYDLVTEVKKTELIIDNTIQRTSNAKYVKLPYPEITIDYSEINKLKIPSDYIYVLRVIQNGVPYEYLINRKSGNDKLIVFNNGAVVGGNVNVPIFQRHSWSQMLKTSSIFCMDPTLYVNGYLQVAWGVGKNENYYLENSSLILKQIIAKMNIKLENTVIYGTSAGGYLSVIMGIYLRGSSVVVDNSQFDISNWIVKEAFETVVTLCFDDDKPFEKYNDRFNVVDAFEKNNYVPKIYILANLCSHADNSTQIVPLLKRMERMNNIDNFNNIEIILRYEPEKGHDGLNLPDITKFIYKILGEA